MASSRLQLLYRLWGAHLHPECVTEKTGVTPSRSFQIGESRGRAASQVAGWEWHSASGEDIAPLLAEMLNLLGPHTTLLRRCVDDGADATLSVVGTLGGILVASPEQAQQRRIDCGEGEFAPFLDGDRVELFLTPDVVAFLAAIGAGFNTHIDYELMNERPNWWEHP